MTDTIDVKDDSGGAIGSTVNSNTLSLGNVTTSTSNYLVYSSYTVGEIIAYLDSSELVLTLTPESGSNAFHIEDIDVSPGATAIGGGGVTWSTNTGNNVVTLTFKTPPSSNQELVWQLNNQAPTVPVRVKIKRR